MGALIGVGLTLLLPVALGLGVVIGICVCVFLKREELRTAQRGVEEARALLVAAGIDPTNPTGLGLDSATPAHAERR
jgi:hypothetical protein